MNKSLDEKEVFVNYDAVRYVYSHFKRREETNDAEHNLMLALAASLNIHNGEVCPPSIALLMDRTHLTKDRLTAARDSLAKKGLISFTLGSGRTNSNYNLLFLRGTKIYAQPDVVPPRVEMTPSGGRKSPPLGSGNPTLREVKTDPRIHNKEEKKEDKQLHELVSRNLAYAKAQNPRNPAAFQQWAIKQAEQGVDLTANALAAQQKSDPYRGEAISANGRCDHICRRYGLRPGVEDLTMEDIAELSSATIRAFKGVTYEQELNNFCDRAVYPDGERVPLPRREIYARLMSAMP